MKLGQYKISDCNPYKPIRYLDRKPFQVSLGPEGLGFNAHGALFWRLWCSTCSLVGLWGFGAYPPRPLQGSKKVEPPILDSNTPIWCRSKRPNINLLLDPPGVLGKKLLLRLFQDLDSQSLFLLRCGPAKLELVVLRGPKDHVYLRMLHQARRNPEIMDSTGSFSLYAMYYIIARYHTPYTLYHIHTYIYIHI